MRVIVVGAHAATFVLYSSMRWTFQLLDGQALFLLDLPVAGGLTIYSMTTFRGFESHPHGSGNAMWVPQPSE
jgi:hypothetical protein